MRNSCKENCESIWEEAERGPAKQIDVFNEDCLKACDIEYGDNAIQRYDEAIVPAKQINSTYHRTSPPTNNASDKVMVELSGGSDAIATLATEKLAGRVGGVLEGVGILW